MHPTELPDPDPEYLSEFDRIIADHINTVFQNRRGIKRIPQSQESRIWAELADANPASKSDVIK